MEEGTIDRSTSSMAPLRDADDHQCLAEIVSFFWPAGTRRSPIRLIPTEILKKLLPKRW
jgi:hypothetical protein